VGMMAVGTLAFLLWSRRLARWPFAPEPTTLAVAKKSE
jgi:hypothetical protein